MATRWKFSTNIFEKKITEPIQSVLKRILNRKSWSRKEFPLNIFLWDSTIFDKNGHMVKIFDKIFWKNIFLESIQDVSKYILNRKSWYRKKFPVENLGLGLDRFFENGHVVKYPLKSKAVLTPKAWFPDFGLAPRFFLYGAIILFKYNINQTGYKDEFSDWRL